MALILKHQTAEAFIARVRQAYRDGTDPTISVSTFDAERNAA